jgi:hypothetical protein
MKSFERPLRGFAVVSEQILNSADCPTSLGHLKY